MIAVGYASYRTYLRKKLVRHLASRRKCLDACWALLSRDGVVTLDTWLRLCAKHKDIVKQKQVRCPLPPPPLHPVLLVARACVLQHLALLKSLASVCEVFVAPPLPPFPGCRGDIPVRGS